MRKGQIAKSHPEMPFKVLAWSPVMSCAFWVNYKEQAKEVSLRKAFTMVLTRFLFEVKFPCLETFTRFILRINLHWKLWDFVLIFSFCLFSCEILQRLRYHAVKS